MVEDRKSNFIGRYFRQRLEMTGFSRKVLAQRLGFNYSDNARMICARLSKRDYLWGEYEVEEWCKIMHIDEDMPIYAQLKAHAGKKSYDSNE